MLAYTATAYLWMRLVPPTGMSLGRAAEEAILADTGMHVRLVQKQHLTFTKWLREDALDKMQLPDPHTFWTASKGHAIPYALGVLVEIVDLFKIMCQRKQRVRESSRC